MRRFLLSPQTALLTAGFLVVVLLLAWFQSDPDSDAAASAKTRGLDAARHRLPSAGRVMDDGAAEILRQLRQAGPLRPGESVRDEAVALLRRWAALDPASAIAFAAEHPEFHGAIHLPAELWAEWHEHAPGAALAWADSCAEHLRASVRAALVSSLAETDPALALRIAGEAPAPERAAWIPGIFDEWAAHDAAAAAAAAASLPEDERCLAFAGLAPKWLEDQPREALAWLHSLPPDAARQSAFLALLPEWTAAAPEDAADFAMSVSGPDERLQACAAVVTAWAGHDPGAASAWLSAWPPGDDRDAGINALLEHWAAAGPEMMEPWLPLLADSTLRAGWEARWNHLTVGSAQ